MDFLRPPALYVFTTMTHTGLLGALFALSTAPFYQLYADRASALGIDAARDQQLAGLVMWIPAGVILMLFGLALVVAWIAELERRLRASRVGTPAPTGHRRAQREGG